MAKLKIFVACPYTLFPIDDYKKSFQSVAKNYEVSFQFADERITNQHILEKVSNYVRDSDFSIFDITGWNPNVTLELGLAVGLGKKYFIFLNSKLEASREAPSDIRGLDRVQYNSNSELEAKLSLLIKQEIPDSSGSDSAFEKLTNKIQELLGKEPGLGLSRVAQSLDEEKSLVQSVLRAMAANGALKTKGAKKGTVYYTADTDLRSVGGRSLK